LQFVDPRSSLDDGPKINSTERERVMGISMVALLVLVGIPLLLVVVGTIVFLVARGSDKK
jgi:hypothetical protein